MRKQTLAKIAGLSSAAFWTAGVGFAFSFVFCILNSWSGQYEYALATGVSIFGLAVSIIIGGTLHDLWRSIR